MINKKTDEKDFHFRMPKETWLLLKNAAITHECSMGELTVMCIEKRRKKLEAKQ